MTPLAARLELGFLANTGPRPHILVTHDLRRVIIMELRTRIAPCLWFDSQAVDAARFYVSVFENSGIDSISRYGKEGFEVHGRPAGSVMTVVFRLAGQDFTALNGGPHFKFTEAISLQVFCETQDEVDRLWDKLSQGGETGQCGWLKDKFGLSWQIVPSVVPEMACDPDPVKSGRAMSAIMQMTKLDIAALIKAFEGLVANASMTINAPVDKVWNALVNPEAVKRYMFGTDVVSDWRVGSPIVWKGEWQGKSYDDKGVVLRCEPCRVLQYSHYSPLSGLPDEPQSYHTVTVSLTNGGNQTHISLAQDNNATEQERKHSEGNWEMVLTGLKKFLEL